MELARKIAQRILNATGEPAYRVALKATREGGAEADLGGLGEHALTSNIFQTLEVSGTSASLLGMPPPGCHCTRRCSAPRIMGKQMPCRDPEKAARIAAGVVA